MGNVYLAVYLAATPDDLVESSRATPVSRAFIEAVRRSEWMYDVGDDPSFYCAGHLEVPSPLTWGICRRDLRGALAIDDTVAFVAHKKREGGGADYYFSGFATVAGKISQADIWEDCRFSTFRSYLNLLVRPDGVGVYAHHEIQPGRVHDDWLWRLTTSRGHGWHKSDFEKWRDARCEKTVIEGRDCVRGEPVRFAPNYVVFSTYPSETVMLNQPVLVGTWLADWGPQRGEQWIDAPLARKLKELTLNLVPGRATLRLVSADPTRTEMRQRHRHLRIPERTIKSRDWRRGMLESIQRDL